MKILEYVTHHLKMAGTPITRNLRVQDAADIRSVQQAFQANASYVPERKNGVFFYHEILSFSPEDSPHLSPTILADIAARYLELRAAEAIGYGTVHLDRGHRHIHVVFSANLKRQKKNSTSPARSLQASSGRSRPTRKSAIRSSPTPSSSCRRTRSATANWNGAGNSVPAGRSGEAPLRN